MKRLENLHQVYKRKSWHRHVNYHVTRYIQIKIELCLTTLLKYSTKISAVILINLHNIMYNCESFSLMSVELYFHSARTLMSQPSSQQCQLSSNAWGGGAHYFITWLLLSLILRSYSRISWHSQSATRYRLSNLTLAWLSCLGGAITVFSMRGECRNIESQMKTYSSE